MSDKRKMSLDDLTMQNERRQAGGNNHDGHTSPRKYCKGGALQSVVTRKPANDGGGVIRDRSRGGIDHNRRTGGIHRVSDLKRKALLGSSTNRNFCDGEPTKLIISNLDYGVTHGDIHELFSEFGRLKRASVNYDQYNRSLGSADVVFEWRTDAIKVSCVFITI